MSKIKCIIVEDEPLAVKVLSDYVAQIPFLELQATFKDAILATEWLRDNTVDLIFLDIHLPKLKGMAFLKTLSDPPAVIITTAYHQYAIEGFEQSVTDYLLKPIEFERFLAAVNKVKKIQPAYGNPEAWVGAPTYAEAMAGKGEIQKPAESIEVKDYLFVNVQKKKVKILFSEIVYIESQREYIRIKTTKAEWISKMSTHEIEDLLPPQLFKRIHRSFIVSVSKIEYYTAEEVSVGGVSIPVGRAYRDVIENL